MRSYIRVKNFEKFQHYKDRNPVWIKLYNEILDDYAFACLQDASKWLAVGIWLLASRHDNKVPNDPAWIGKRINATGPVDLAALVSAGFIEVCGEDSQPLADRSVSAMPEREEETEEETEEEKKGAEAPLSGSGKPNADEAVRIVWGKWVEESGRKATLTKERRNKIKTRLRSFSVDQLCATIVAAHRNPFYLGENERETYYGNIETIFRNDTAVTKHLEWAEENPPMPKLTLHRGGMADDPREAEARRQNADAEHHSAVDAWKHDVARRFAKEPEGVRESWKSRVAPALEVLRTRRPETYDEALRLAVFREYGPTVGMPEPVRRAS